MKILSLLLLSALIITSSGCIKDPVENCDKIPAKIIRYDCDRVIFSLQTNEQIGDPQWIDYYSKKMYFNVVSYYDFCRIKAITQMQLKTLFVTVQKTNQHQGTQGCAVCLGDSKNPPQTMVLFPEIETEPCVLTR